LLSQLYLLLTMSTTISPSLIALNTQQAPPTSFPYTLFIPPNTDLWVKPIPFASSSPAAKPTFAANQPSFVQAIPLKTFRSATATVSFVPNVLYDQAGVVFLFPE
jgi:hypothetical protein